PIAIVGMAGRFPGAENVDELWKALMDGQDLHTEIPRDRFDAQSHLDAPAFGCFLDKPGLFDSRFFNISPREALQTDPGQRLALTTAYEALEMAGFVPNRTPSSQLERVGTFYGQVADEYKEQNATQQVGTYFIPGTMRAFGPGRISHFFRFGGPSMTIDTACSSSLVALHVACNAIWNGDCDTAVVGGMNIVTSSDNYNGLISGHFLSPTGSCKTFDNAADGYCRGEAVASIVIKPLSAAIADNDKILGTLLSSSMNHSWGSSSITHPWAPAQQRLFRKVVADAGIRPGHVNYIEMHGTGTQAGDAVEMSSILNTFATPRHSSHFPLLLGSIKANLGHGESASGITSVIKALLMIRQKLAPPHVGIKSVINSQFPPMSERNVAIPRQAISLPDSITTDEENKTTILINNFDAAGGNAACIISQASKATEERRKIPTKVPNWLPIAISAKSWTSLEGNAQGLRQYLKQVPQPSLVDLSYTTMARRIHHRLRAVKVVSTVAEAEEALNSISDDGVEHAVSGERKLALIFTGQGAFDIHSVRLLAQSCGYFRATLLHYNQIATSQRIPSFEEFITNEGGEPDFVSKQVLILGVQMALLRLLQRFGLRPDLVLGHSFGEYAALVAAEVLTARDAIRLVGTRARLLEKYCSTESHLMLAVNASLDTIRETLDEKLSTVEVACFNSPQDTVLVGSADTIQDLLQIFKPRGTRCKILGMPFGHHSAQMEPLLGDLREELECLTFKTPSIAVATPTASATVVRSSPTLNAEYIVRQIRDPVHFRGALEASQAEGFSPQNTCWLEIGTTPVCLAMIHATMGPCKLLLSSMRPKEHPWKTLSCSLARMHSYGYNVSWDAYYADLEGLPEVLHLPSYAWEQKNYWIPYENDWRLHVHTKSNMPKTQVPSSLPKQLTTTVHRLVLEESISDVAAKVVFETDFAYPPLRDVIKGHAVAGKYLCPASVYTDMAMTIADHARRTYPLTTDASGMTVKRMEIMQPILVPEQCPPGPQLVNITALVDLTAGCLDIQLCSEFSGEKKQHAQCRVVFSDDKAWSSKLASSEFMINERRRQIHENVAQDDINKFGRQSAYTLFASLVDYSAQFQGLHQVYLAPGLEATATIRLPVAENEEEKFFCSPYWIDSLLHLSGLVLNGNPLFTSKDAVYISHGWRSLRLPTEINPQKQYEVHVRMHNIRPGIYTGTVHIFEQDALVGVAKGVDFRRIPKKALPMLLAAVHDGPITPPAGQNIILTRSRQETPGVTHAPPEKTGESNLDLSSQCEKTMEIISRECGAELRTLPRDTRLESLGIDSLMTLTILGAVRHELGVDLAQAVFHDCKTVGELQEFLLGASGDSSDGTSEKSGSETTPSTLESPPTTLSQLDGLHESREGMSSQSVSILRSIVAQQIGISTEELLQQDQFDDLGVDSLMRLSIMGEVQSQLGFNAMDLLHGGISSYSELEAGFLAKLCPTPAVLPSRAEAHDRRGDDSHHTRMDNGHAASHLSNAFNRDPRSAKTFLFLFPDGSGSATVYLNLDFPAFGPDTCVIGLSSPYIRQQGHRGMFTVESLVELWVKEIRKHQPHGPYLLGGWSAGGYYAFEASRALQRAGESVSKLILIDSAPRNAFEAMSEELISVLSKLGAFSDDGRECPGWVTDHFQATVQAIAGYKQFPLAGNGSGGASLDVHIIWASCGVLEDQQHLLSGRQALVTTSSSSSKIARFLLAPRQTVRLPNTEWQQLLPHASITISQAPGTHFNLLRHPQVGESPALTFPHW
ncbi:uncharacterized protein MYCFIDRAFT_20039, partial [Pseudocercospora fijiensis CIRAD86]